MPPPANTSGFPRPQAAPQRRDPALDGVRGVAILWVFLFHYGGGLRAHSPLLRAFGYLTEAGWIGVELFFALSGYLITALFWADRKQPHGWPNFLARRAARILPVYLAALALTAVVSLAAGGTVAALKPLWLYVGLLQDLPPLVPRALQYPPPLPLNHLWTLAVEAQFYLVWPPILLLAHSRRGAFWAAVSLFAGVCVLRLAVFHAGASSPALLNQWSPFLGTRGGALALGAALALLPGGKRRVAPAVPAMLLLCGAAGFALVSLRQHSLLLNSGLQFRAGLPCIELASVAAVACALHPGPLRRLMGWRPLRFLGRISYGLYVFHILLQPCFDVVARSLAHVNTGFRYQAVRMGVAFVLSVAAAAASFQCYEQPLLRWARRRFPQARPVAV